MPLIRWSLEQWTVPPCGAGPCSTWLVVLYRLANLVITVCYLVIPAIVVYYWRYRRDGVSPAKLWMVLAFLPVQALSRLARVDGVGGMPVHLVTVLDTVAAIVTVNSVVWLRPKILHILRLPSRQQLHDLNNALQTKVWQIEVMNLEERKKNAALLAEVDLLRRPVGPGWLSEKHAALDRITAIIRKEE